jgi:hypothetical protein
MTELDVNALGKEMLAAALPILKERTEDASAYADMEFKKIAQTLASITEQFAAGQLSEHQARLLMAMQKNASQSVMLTLEGLGLLSVELAINAALDVVRGTVNRAIGFALL